MGWIGMRVAWACRTSRVSPPHGKNEGRRFWKFFLIYQRRHYMRLQYAYMVQASVKYLGARHAAHMVIYHDKHLQ